MDMGFVMDELLTSGRGASALGTDLTVPRTQGFPTPVIAGREGRMSQE
jgi:hypothetical protein